MSMDLMPTFLDLARATPPPGHKLDGVSLVSLLRDDKLLAPRKLFWNKWSSWAIRDGSWKLLLEKSEVYLFDLASDLSEEHNLAARQSERVKAMQAELELWAKEVGAK